ncbi:hypothetical protein ACHAWU_005798 [Discostella pseudostelligera]|uniref:Pre-mRNA-splicing factor CWC26 n=1 Tax=Discostella pseudostelligera TaxID=259834 RepID=A0ABD3MER3_9STRA
MAKSNDSSKAKPSKKSTNVPITSKPQKRGLDEIDNLFAQKKQSDKELREKAIQEKEASKLERKRRKQARLEEEADEIALRGSSSLTTTASAAAGGGGAAVGKRKGDAVAPASLFEKATKLPSLTYSRVDVEQLDKDKDKWATDGLGGVFNGEGFTGRRDDGGHRVFKAHLMNKKGFGQSPDCPFDCNCCFI